jgi:hypothetical protein
MGGGDSFALTSKLTKRISSDVTNLMLNIHLLKVRRRFSEQRLNVVFFQVYDVSKGASYYGPGGGYAFFSGKDGSRAFVSGQFDAEGLVEDVSGLASADYLGLQVSCCPLLFLIFHIKIVAKSHQEA